MGVIDVWAQQPTKTFLAQPYFDSLKRWTSNDFDDVPLEFLLQTMAAGNVTTALIAAWYGPQGALISNEDVLDVVHSEFCAWFTPNVAGPRKRYLPLATDIWQLCQQSQ